MDIDSDSIPKRDLERQTVTMSTPAYLNGQVTLVDAEFDFPYVEGEVRGSGSRACSSC